MHKPLRCNCMLMLSKGRHVVFGKPMVNSKMLAAATEAVAAATLSAALSQCILSITALHRAGGSTASAAPAHCVLSVGNTSYTAGSSAAPKRLARSGLHPCRGNHQHWQRADEISTWNQRAGSARGATAAASCETQQRTLYCNMCLPGDGAGTPLQQYYSRRCRST
jgi:hypothetical protein